MKKLFAVFMAMLIVFSICVPSFAVEIDNTNASGNAIATYEANSSFKVTIPTYIAPSEKDETASANMYSVTASDVFIPDGNQLTVTVDYDGILTDRNGVEIPYKLFSGGSEVTNGQKIIAKDAGNPDDTATVNFSAAVQAEPRYAGTYTDTVTFNISVEERIYSLEEINADEHLYAIGKTKPEYVVAKFNDDYSKATISKNGVKSDGKMKDLNTMTMGRYDSPFTANAKTLKDAVVKDGVINISDCAFDKCTSLENITISESVTSIGFKAFSECKLLKSIIIPDGVISIDDSAFYRCSSLTSATIGNNVTSIGRSAFYECISLENIIIPDSVTSVGLQAFYNCRILTNVTIGNGVINIDNRAFEDCTSITNIFVGAGNKNYCDIDGVLFNKSATNLICYPSGKTGDYVIPNSVTNIDNNSFYKCYSLTNIAIPDSVTNIGDNAFMYCSKLRSITIPASVTNIGSQTFAYCSALENIFVDTGNENYCDIDGVLFNKNATELIRCPQKRNGNYVIPDGVTSIPVGAFFYCSSLESVTVPASVTSINSNAFNVCNKLKTIYGVSGSYAETFAAEKGYTFIAQS